MFNDSPECRDQWCEFASTASEHVLVGEDKMRRALRVLNAVVVRGQADPSDVAELRRVAPLLTDVPVEELAWACVGRCIERSDFGAQRAVSACRCHRLIRRAAIISG
jgi:hypothetical protein